jgi:pimeloyl-ACP methyl ester carboxylesterase/quercetin dioxygenase-like cupin family protein
MKSNSLPMGRACSNSSAVLQATAVLLFGLVCFGSRASQGHDTPWTEQPVRFAVAGAEVAGTFTIPEHGKELEQPADSQRYPCVVIVGGTMSHTRDGGLVRDGAPPRDALRRLAHELAKSGYASLRYDKVGFGQSTPTDQWTGSYQDEARVAAAAIQYARSRDDVHTVAAAGESAGAYLLCLAAKSGTEADAYLFLGGHCDSGPAIYEYNFARLVRYAESNPQRRKWAEERFPMELALGRGYQQMFAAAASGETVFELVDGDFHNTVGLARRKEELDMPPDQVFRFIRKPVLAVAGGQDLNVPPDHAARIVQVLRKAGNHNSTCFLIPGCDHSFQIGPADEDTRFRERYTFESFRRDYSPQLYREIVAWLDDTLGYAPSSQLPSVVAEVITPTRGVQQAERDPKTQDTPDRLFLAPGIQIVEDITDKRQTTGVQTLEGEIGPLLLGQDCQTHFIDMPAGMYCDEHPHSSESMIYTVRGRWVLCSRGRRQVMQPGSLFHFAAETPTGYEVPFSDDALILIFKGKRLTAKEKDFIDYLQGLATRLQREQEAGVPYLLSDLPDDHPAIAFARQVNPDFAK